MVWGMSLPATFGEFWPDGDFEGVDKNGNELWRERLRLYYLAQSPEEQRRLHDYGSEHVGHGAANYLSDVKAKFTRELGTPRQDGGPALTPVESHEAPRSFVTVKTYKTLGSLIELNDRILAVDGALKTIIERLEPGVHQFFPIEIGMPRGHVYPAQYYILVIGQYFDSFLPQNSTEGAWRPSEFGNYFHVASKGEAGLAFSKAVFGQAHLWRERRSAGLLTCFSDELRGEIAKAGLRTPKLLQMKEI